MSRHRRCLFTLVALSMALLPLAPTVYAADLPKFASLYPGAKAGLMQGVQTEEGITEAQDGASILPAFVPRSYEAAKLESFIAGRQRSFLIESLRLIPYGDDGAPTLAELRFALSQIRGLAGRTYLSSSRGKEIPLFEEATRIESLRRQNSRRDPALGTELAANETAIIRLKDANFGNSFYSAQVETSEDAIVFKLINLKSITYGFIPVIPEDRFFATLYIAPLTEGLLIYGVAGAEVSGFVASRVNMPSAVRKRLNVIVEWIGDRP